MNALDDAERAELCEKHFTLQLPSATDCGNGNRADFPGQTVDDCIDHWVPETCPATEREWRDCMEVLEDRVCTLAGYGTISTCDALNGCFDGGIAVPAGLREPGDTGG